MPERDILMSIGEILREDLNRYDLKFEFSVTDRGTCFNFWINQLYFGAVWLEGGNIRWHCRKVGNILVEACDRECWGQLSGAIVATYKSYTSSPSWR